MDIQRNTLSILITFAGTLGGAGCEGNTGDDPAVQEAPGYVVVQIDSIHDPDVYFTDYADRAGPTLVEHGFSGMVASAEPQRLEGSAPDGWTVLIQFPTVPAAEAWYDDPDYVAARPFRVGSVGTTDMAVWRGDPDAPVELSAFGGYMLEQSEEVGQIDDFDSYLSTSASSMQDFGGVVLAEGEPVRVLEGQWPDDSTRIVGFPTVSAIDDWYGASASQQFHGARRQAAEGLSLAGFERFCPPDAGGDCG